MHSSEINETEHILIVEDDPSLAQWISDYLIDHGYQVSVANRGNAAVEMITEDVPDLVVLDIMLPEKNGLDICKEVRQFFPRPILMLTACTEETDEILSLELGADDYLHKPVRPRVLLARIKALLRRSAAPAANHILSFGNLTIDNASKSVCLSEQDIALSSNEFDLLWLLAKNAGHVISRADLVAELRGIDYDGFDRSVDIRISRLRKKLGDDKNTPLKIKTVRGKGYFFAHEPW